MKSEFTNFTGRYSRKTYWIKMLTILLTVLFIYGSIIIAINLIAEIRDMARLIILVIGMTSTWAYVSISIKRLHDLNKTGWLILFYFVPFANIYLWIMCGFYKGTHGENKYGPDPIVLPKSES